MSDWEAARAQERDAFLEDLAHRGFSVASADRADGSIAGPDGAPIDITLQIPDAFPYKPPRVLATWGDGGMSWHREPADGALCLYTEEDFTTLPWRDAGTFLARVEAWFEKDAGGWVDDPPDLDLERYWTTVKDLILYDDLSDLERAPLVAAREEHLFEIRIGKEARGWSGNNLRAAVADIGELDRPVRSWDEVADRLADADWIAERIGKGSIKLLLLQYARQGHRGVLALHVVKRSPIEFEAIPSAHQGDETLRLRAGPDAEVLRSAAVAVVGIGAVGSVIVDLLARAGLGRLTLIDRDVLRPGNCVRHVADLDYVGWNKAEAMADIVRRAPWASDDVSAIPERLDTPETAEELLANHDLVIDATANGRATALVFDGATHAGRNAVSVCVQRDGGLARVDRAPLAAGEQWLDPPPDLPTSTPELREGGCGDPVSQTPAWACHAAGVLATAVAVDTLAGKNTFGPSVVQVLMVQPDAPYEQLRMLP